METVTVDLCPSSMLEGSTDMPNSAVSLSRTVVVAQGRPDIWNPEGAVMVAVITLASSTNVSSSISTTRVAMLSSAANSTDLEREPLSMDPVSDKLTLTVSGCIISLLARVSLNVTLLNSVTKTEDGYSMATQGTGGSLS